MFDNREYPQCPKEFLARAVYPKVFEDCEGLRAQVGVTPRFHTPASKPLRILRLQCPVQHSDAFARLSLRCGTDGWLEGRHWGLGEMRWTVSL